MTTAFGTSVRTLGSKPSKTRHALITVVCVVAAGLLISLPLLGVVFFALLASVGALGLIRRDVAPLALFIVLLFVTSPRHQFVVLRLPVAILLGLGLTVIWLLGRTAPSAPNSRGDRSVSLAILALFTTLLLTYVLGLARPLRYAQIQGADRDVLILIALCGVAMLVSDIARTQRTRRLIAALLIGGAVFSAFAGLIQQALAIDLSQYIRLPGFRDAGLFESGRERLGLTRAHGTARHPIEFGTSLALAFPFSLHFAAYGRTRMARLAGLVASVVIVSGLATSLSRSALVSLLVILVVVVPSWTPRRRLNAALTGVAIIAVMFMWQPHRLNSAIELAVNWRGENIDGVGIDSRTGDYEIVARMVSEHPLVGEGYGAHVSFALDNEYLDTAIESGVLGVLALLAAVVVPFWVAGVARREAQARGDPAEADFAVAIRASLLASAIALATYDGLSFPQFAFSAFVIIGLAGAMRRRTPGLRSTAVESPLSEPSTDAATRPQT